jgi:predicted AAA+ superfamily ATPase
VDIVVEHGGKVSGVEVKASATVRSSDFAGLRMLSEACGKRFACGVVVYDGESTLSFGDGLLAVPIERLWS